MIATINSELNNMNRLTWLLCGIVLLISPYYLLAQHGGGRGAGAGRPPTGVSNTDDLKDFKRAVALQASPDQVIQFQRLTRSTQAARKDAQDLQLLAGSENKPDLLQHADLLTGAVEEALTENEKFVKGFSAAQKSGLKDTTKKLGKANSEVTKQSKVLTRGLGHSGNNGRQITSTAEKLEKALGDFQAKQRSIGSEMGIQAEGSAQ